MRLVADRIHYAYRPGSDVLHDISLAANDGQALFVLGANGSGKTTLLECLGGIRTPRSGRITIDGIRMTNLSIRDRARRIGVVPQLHEPVFSYTVGQAVLMGRAPHLGLFTHPGVEDRKTVAWALDAVGVFDLRDRPYTEISGGERQLVLIARGLAQGAGCLLMDEPAAHLDPRHQHEVFETVRRLASGGFSFVVTSHQPNNALLYADRVAFLVDGRVGPEGAPEEVVTEEALRTAYELDFELVEGQKGARTVLPRVPSRRTD